MKESGQKSPGASRTPLAAQDEPGEHGERPMTEPPSTARPDEPEKLAARLDAEAEQERMTEPPAATYEMLRDSCKMVAAHVVPLDEEQILRPSSGTQKVPKK
jgi:hypothetical protein